MKLEKLNPEKFEILELKKLLAINGGSGKGSIVVKTNSKRIDILDEKGLPSGYYQTVYSDHVMTFTSDDAEGCYYGIAYYDTPWEIRS